MITYTKLSRNEQISRLRKMVGQSMHPEVLLRNIMELAEDLYQGRIKDDATLGDVYTAGDLRNVGSWWCVGDIMLEITGIYVMNIILEAANHLKVDKAKEKAEIMRLMTVYGRVQIDVAVNAAEYMMERHPEGEVSEHALDLLQVKRVAHLNGMDPKLLAEAKKYQTNLELAMCL